MLIRIFYSAITLLIFVHSAPSPYFTRSFVQTPSASYEQYLVVPDKSDAYRVPVSQVHHYSDFQFPKQQVVYYSPSAGTTNHALQTLQKDSPVWQQMLLNLHAKSDENSLMSDAVNDDKKFNKNEKSESVMMDKSDQLDHQRKFSESDVMRMIFNQENVHDEMMEKLKREGIQMPDDSTTFAPKILMQPIVVTSEEESGEEIKDVEINQEMMQEKINSNQNSMNGELLSELNEKILRLTNTSDDSSSQMDNGQNIPNTHPSMTQAIISDSIVDSLKSINENNEQPDNIQSTHELKQDNGENQSLTRADVSDSNSNLVSESMPVSSVEMNNQAQRVILPNTDRSADLPIKSSQQMNSNFREFPKEMTLEIMRDPENQSEIMIKLVELTTETILNLEPTSSDINIENKNNELAETTEQARIAEKVDQTTEKSMILEDMGVDKLDRILILLEKMFKKDDQSSTAQVLNIENEVSTESNNIEARKSIEIEDENMGVNSLQSELSKENSEILNTTERLMVSNESSMTRDMVSDELAKDNPENPSIMFFENENENMEMDGIAPFPESRNIEESSLIELAEENIGKSAEDSKSEILTNENLIQPTTESADNLTPSSIITASEQSSETILIPTLKPEFNERSLIESTESSTELLENLKSDVSEVREISSDLETSKNSAQMNEISPESTTLIAEVEKISEQSEIITEAPRTESLLIPTQQLKLDTQETSQSPFESSQSTISESIESTSESIKSLSDENEEAINAPLSEAVEPMENIEMVTMKVDNGMEEVRIDTVSASVETENQERLEMNQEILRNLEESTFVPQIQTTTEIQSTDKPLKFGDRIPLKTRILENSIESSSQKDIPTSINSEKSSDIEPSSPDEQSTEKQAEQERITVQSPPTQNANTREGRVNNSPTLFLHNNRFYVISGTPSFYANFDAYQNPRTPIFSLQELQPIKPISNVEVQKIEPFRVFTEENEEQKSSMKNDNETFKMQENTADNTRSDIENEKSMNVERKENEEMMVKVKKREHERQPVSEARRNYDSDEEEEEPGIAQANPEAFSISGPGGLASARPRGTALTGNGGFSVASPKGTALAGKLDLDDSDDVDYDSLEDTKIPNKRRIQNYRRKIVRGRRIWRS